MLSGLPVIDIEDWIANTEYNNYESDDQVVQVCFSMDSLSFLDHLQFDLSKKILCTSAVAQSLCT